MPTQPVPFSGANKNSDEGLQTIGVDLFNAIVDETGNLRRIPGYTEFANLMTGTGVTGLHYNEKNDLVICVSGAKVFILAEDGTATDVTGTGIPVIGIPCTFADFADDIYIANGVQIIKCPIDITQTTSFVTAAEAPTDAYFIANLNSYLLSNSGLAGRVDFSDSGTPETWAGEFFTFEASNDQLQFFGVGDGFDRIHGFGTKSIESWRNDGTTPFTPEGQEYITQGSISPYSPVWIRDTWFFVDQYKNLCRINGRQAQRLPQQNYRGLTAFLNGLYCEDIRSMHVYSNGYHWYVATLPTEQKTFAYNTDLDQWAEWSNWDIPNGEHKQYRPQVSCYATGWQKTLLGDSRSGLVYAMSPSEFTANSAVIRSSVKTGFMNRGDSTKTKFCNRIAGRVVKKNVNGGDDTLKVAVRWRDNNLESAWQQEEIDLYTEDGIEYYYFINGLGSYTSRQWEVICTSDIDFQMTPPEEEFDVSYR